MKFNSIKLNYLSTRTVAMITRQDYLHLLDFLFNGNDLTEQHVADLVEYEHATWESTKEQRFMLDNFCIKLIDVLSLVSPLINTYGLDSQANISKWCNFASAISEKLVEYQQQHQQREGQFSRQEMKTLTRQLGSLLLQAIKALKAMLKQAGLPENLLTHFNNMQQAELRLRHSERHNHLTVKRNLQEVDEALAETVANLVEQVEQLRQRDFFILPFHKNKQNVEALKSASTDSDETKSGSSEEEAKIDPENPLPTAIGAKETGKVHRQQRREYALDPIVTPYVEAQASPWVFMQVTEAAHRYTPDKHGQTQFANLAPLQLAQYFHILNNTKLVENSQGGYAVEHNDYRQELFWFYVIPSAIQVDILKRLKRYEQEAFAEAVATDMPSDYILAQKISHVFGHVGSGAKDSGPSVHIGLSNRHLLWQASRLVFDSHAYLPKHTRTSGVYHRNAMPALSSLNLQDRTFEQLHVQFVMQIIEQDIQDRATAMIERYRYELGEWFAAHGEEVQYTLTRYIIDLLSPGRLDELMRLVMQVFGKSFNEDNRKMTALLIEATKQLRKKYRDLALDVIYPAQGEAAEKKYTVKVNFAVEIEGINGIRKSNGLIGLLQMDNNVDSTGPIAAMCQMAHELTLYANGLVAPLSQQPEQELTEIPDRLMVIAKDLMQLTASSDIRLLPTDKLESMSASIETMKQSLTALYHREPTHTANVTIMRLEMFVQYLMTLNHGYVHSHDYNLELMAAAFLGVALNPEGLSANCKSGHDRTGAWDNMVATLHYTYHKYNRRLPDMQQQTIAEWALGKEQMLRVWRTLTGQMAEAHRFIPSDDFFNDNLNLLLSNHELRARGQSGNESGLKSLPQAYQGPLAGKLFLGSSGAHSTGLLKAAARAGVIEQFKIAKEGAGLYKHNVKKSGPAVKLSVDSVSEKSRVALSDRLAKVIAKKVGGMDGEQFAAMQNTEISQQQAHMLNDIRQSMMTTERDWDMANEPMSLSDTLQTVQQRADSQRDPAAPYVELRRCGLFVLSPHRQRLYSEADAESGIGIQMNPIHHSEKRGSHRISGRSLTTSLSRDLEANGDFELRAKQEAELTDSIRECFQWALLYHNLDAVSYRTVIQAVIGVLLCSLATTLTFQYYGSQFYPPRSFEEEWSTGKLGNNVYTVVVLSLFDYGTIATLLWDELIVQTLIIRHYYLEAFKQLAIHTASAEQKNLGERMIEQLRALALNQQRFPQAVIDSAHKALTASIIANRSNSYLFSNCGFLPCVTVKDLLVSCGQRLVEWSLPLQRFELFVIPITYSLLFIGWMLSEWRFIATALAQEFAVDFLLKLNGNSLGANEHQEQSLYSLLSDVSMAVSCAKIVLTFLKKESWNKKLPEHNRIGVNISESYSFVGLFKNNENHKSIPSIDSAHPSLNQCLGK